MSKPLPRVPVTWDWSGVVTDKDDRKIQLGELTSLINYRRTVEGRLQKRLGNDRTITSSFFGATFAGPVTDVVPSDALIIRDTSNQLFVRSATDGYGYYRGTDVRAHPTWSRIENGHPPGGVHKPLVVLGNESGTSLFCLSLGIADSTWSKRIEVTERDAATGVVLCRPSFINAPNASCFTAAAASNGDVWVAWVETSTQTTIQTRQLGTFGTVVTAGSIFVSGYEIKDVKLRLMPNNQLMVVAVSVDTIGATYEVKRYHAYLNTATGGAKVSPAEVTATVAAGPVIGSINVSPGLSIADSQDSTGTYHYHLWYASDTTTLKVHTVSVTPADLTASGADARSVTVSAADRRYIGATAGYRTAGGVSVVVSSIAKAVTIGTTPAATRAFEDTVVKSVSGADTVLARSAYLAADDAFKVGTTRYILTGHDDYVEETPAQRGYFVRDLDGRIATSILDGVGGGFAFNGNVAGSFDLSGGHTVSPAVSGNKVYLPLLESGEAESIYEPVLATVDFAATWDSKALGIVPGGVPKYVSKEDTATELAPIHYPFLDLAVSNNGGGANYSRNRIAYRYTTVNASGERVPSAPRTTLEVQFTASLPADGFILSVPSLRHAIGPTWVEVFMSDDQDEGDHATAGTELYLAKRVPNDPTADTVAVNIGDPQQFVAGSGELLDTTNLTERLVNTSVPPARLWAVWRGRLFGAGTPEDDIIYSQETRADHGYEFNAGGLSVVWTDGTGPITALYPLSYEAMVLFRRDAIGLIGGAGPDPAGNGNYVVQTISTQKGTTNPKGVVQGPQGIYFIETNGRPHVVTTGGQIVEIAKGYESYTAQVPTAAVHDAAQRVVRWYCSSGKQIKLDYAHPLLDQPAGQWGEDNNSNLPAAVGACVIGGSAVMVEAGTDTFLRQWQAGSDFDDNGTAVLTELVTGRMSPAGLLGEFDVDEVQLSSTRLGGDSAYTYTLTDDQGTAEPHPDIASAVADVAFRSAISRTREIRLRIQETSATGEGRSFDGVSMIVRPRGQRNFHRKTG